MSPLHREGKRDMMPEKFHGVFKGSGSVSLMNMRHATW
jgi:hypothetical protein